MAPATASEEVRVCAAEDIVEDVQLITREARLVTLLPLVLVGTSKFLEGVSHLRNAARYMGTFVWRNNQ